MNMPLVALFIGAYLLGAVPFGVLLVRRKGIDLTRQKTDLHCRRSRVCIMQTRLFDDFLFIGRLKHGKYIAQFRRFCKASSLPPPSRASQCVTRGSP